MSGVRVSLRWKLTLMMTAVIGALSLLAFVHFRDRSREEAMAFAREEALRMAEMAAFSVSPALLFDDRLGAREALSGICTSSVVASVHVFGRNGLPFAKCEGIAPSPAGVLRAGVPVIHDGRVIGQLRLELSLAGVADQIAANRRGLAEVTLLTFCLGVAAVLSISVLVTRPLRSITAAAEAIRSGDGSRRADAGADDEIGVLARTFNLMLDELEQNRKDLEGLNRGLEHTVEQRTREVTLLLQSTYDGILATDEAMRCVMVNRAAERTLGMRTEQILGRDLHELVHGDCQIASCSLLSVLRKGGRGELKEVFSRPGASSVSADVSIAPILDREATRGSVVTFRDVTERDRLQYELEQTRRVSSMGTLAATMAHEINNVLMGILPFVELIGRVDAGSKVAKYCAAITQSVNRGRRVTQEVLRFTRPQTPTLGRLDLSEWIAEFTPMLRMTAGESIVLKVVVREAGLAVDCDREQVEQVLVNIVGNARAAMPRGGVVEIRLARNRNAVEISVIDNGSGMPEDTRRRVFEPFFTTKGIGGTGLGMPIAGQIVSAHGGRITVESTPGSGTRFDISLPLATGAGEERGIDEPTDGPSVRRLLLVEDDVLVASGLKGVLEAHGIDVEVASTGSNALAALARSVPDGVVLDIGLPDIDGIDLYWMIARSHAGLPVVFSTGHGDESQIKHLLERPDVRFILKPYLVTALLAKFAEICAGPARA